MAYATTTIKQHVPRYSKINRKISKPIKTHQKHQIKGFKKHKHFHYNRKHKKNSPYSPIYKISQPYKPIYFSDQHKPYIQEQETKWLYQTSDDVDKNSQMKYTSIRKGSNCSNRRFDSKMSIGVQQEYKSYVDSNVIMKLLMGQLQGKKSQQLQTFKVKYQKQNNNKNSQVNSKEEELIQLQLLSQIQKQFNSININNRMKQEEHEMCE